MATSLWDLPPWEQLPYCTVPKASYLTSLGSGGQIVAANNQRCGLLMSPVGTTAVVIAPTATTSTGNGFTVPTSFPFVYFSSNEHGILASIAWFNIAPGIGWSVLELIATDWPQEGDHYLDSIKPPPPQNIQTVLPTKQGVGGLQGVASYWKNLMSKIKGG